jgi:uncharacterized protein YdaU (DUF1376 family)
MTAKDNAFWYARHYKDYQQDTSHLSILEHGAYTLLLDLYYLSGKPLMADAMALARQVRCLLPEERLAMESVLHQFFVLEEDGWHNKRADEEIAKRRQLIDSKKKAGAFGASKRWQADGMCHSTLDGISDAQENSIRDTQTHTHTQTQRTNLQPKAKGQSPDSADAPSGGSRVWGSYADAYRKRYGIDPVRNARTNALCSQLVKRLGDEAQHVASFYVQHSKQFYVLKGHPLTLLVADAETLRTEWATGKRITATGARQADRTQATGQAFAALIHEQGGGHAD